MNCMVDEHATHSELLIHQTPLLTECLECRPFFLKQQRIMQVIFHFLQNENRDFSETECSEELVV